jgi:hypothetical protein
MSVSGRAIGPEAIPPEGRLVPPLSELLIGPPALRRVVQVIRER